MHFGHIKNIHFVGIGGIGMSGIAEILTNYDLAISGCDARASEITERLSRSGIPVAIGHDRSHIRNVDLVVISSAVKQSNAEVVYAREVHVPVIRRAEMLGEITRLKRGVAIAGTHGKTTTAAMVALVLSEAGLDPTLIVGGVLRNIESSSRLGQGEYLVVEADEYDRSFLTLHPNYAVITNIEADHLDCYRDLDDIRNAFGEFATRVPFFGSVIGCIDDPDVAALLDWIPKRTVRYGMSDGARLRATNLEFTPAGVNFEVAFHRNRLGRVELKVPGEHNVRNALAAIGVALELDIPFPTVAAALGKFRGVERRFQILGEFHGALVVDDYAHHPTEIRATLEAARHSYPDRRLIALFQPHLYSRTRDFYEGFAEALHLADQAYLTPIYPAREEPIPGVTSDLIVAAAGRRGAGNVMLVDRAGNDLIDFMRSVLKANDLCVTMGAGDIHRIGEALAGVQR